MGIAPCCVGMPIFLTAYGRSSSSSVVEQRPFVFFWLPSQTSGPKSIFFSPEDLVSYLWLVYFVDCAVRSGHEEASKNREERKIKEFFRGCSKIRQIPNLITVIIG